MQDVLLASMAAIRQVLVYCGILMGLVLVLAAVLVLLRRRFHRARLDRDQMDPAGFSIEQLEALRRSGQISGEEFSTLRRTALRLDALSEREDTSVMENEPGADENRAH